MRGVQFNLNIPILICYVRLIVVIILDIRYGNVTECDKLMDKPIGFVHMDNQKVICTANTFVVLHFHNLAYLTLYALLKPFLTGPNLIHRVKSAEQAVRKINGLAYKGKRLKVELSNT